MTISQWPDVLAEEHDSLNLFSTGEDSAKLIEEIVFLVPWCEKESTFKVEVRLTERRVIQVRQLNNSQCKL